jgi:hypothetical protein
VRATIDHWEHETRGASKLVTRQRFRTICGTMESTCRNLKQSIAEKII